ncbi:hypothetical protein J7T55_004061 [Diaporthe amygdali]|uniref:uncharacterized protein n=1 Tax=Phomopsis amygdali TaxID=1214568 RepID=UPI0022FE38C9|nr:uncharacterized protein J7T55_004061 [Diaporthe amygdali]KAJ0115892.1 hypothetical protein J7T55_004061 [Diaporthe amygdali]
MFGSLSQLIPPVPPPPEGPPKDAPPPTPVDLPRCRPRASEGRSVAPSDSAGAPAPPHLTSLLQDLVRPPDQVDVAHLEAIGVDVTADVPLTQLVPDPSCLPDFAQWDTLSREEAQVSDSESRPTLNNGRLASGPSKYAELRQSLATDNEKAFRAVRRVAPKPGEQYVRLGYCHEFFRHLEALTGFWDDTSKPKPPDHTGGKPVAEGDRNYGWYRTSAGSVMPAQYRTQLLTSFLKLIIYDFSCNVMSRQEPRLYIKSPLPEPQSTPVSPAPPRRHSYFSSGCNFVFRMPSDRESAKRGIVEGPIAAVSPRHTTVFPPHGRERESVIDLSREVIAALITAQHRAREGRKEERVGKDAWWTTKPRWGGGPGGPIGKEAEALEARDTTAVLIGDKDERPVDAGRSAAAEGEPGDVGAPPIVSPRQYMLPSPSSRGGTGQLQPPHPKRPKRGLAVYDAYRMVRPPALHWDPKTRYTPVGRQRGVDYDDVFVISSLFHHMSVLRVRVPDRLLQVLDGAPTPNGRDWGKLQVWRTRWFDFFVPDDRVDAMKAVWGVVAYAMRAMEEEGNAGSEMDVDRGGPGARRS